MSTVTPQRFLFRLNNTQLLLTFLTREFPSMCYGFTLLEVMISMLLLAMAMLAMDVMAVQSLHESQRNYLFSVALNEMASMSERLQVWQNTSDLSSRWNKELNNLLPLAQGQVNGVFPDYTITLSWSKSECLTNTVHVV